MPFGNVLGEVTLKVMSVRHTDIGGGQVRLEVDLVGEGTGQLPGQHVGSLPTVAVNVPTCCPGSWTVPSPTRSTSSRTWPPPISVCLTDITLSVNSPRTLPSGIIYLL